MNNFRGWLFDFMQGRYGFDELGRHLGGWFLGLIIASIVLGVIGSLAYDVAGSVVVSAAFNLLAIFVNWASMAVLIWMFFRILSRKREKRAAENARYLERRDRRAARRDGSKGDRRGRGQWRRSGSKGQDPSLNKGNYLYLACPFCGQEMRVPRGKGKIAVKCPSCGEKTIVNS